MATKDQLYQIIAAYGLGRVLPSGSTRAAARTAANSLVKAGRVVIPRVAPPVAAGAMGVGRAAGRAGVALARRNPAVASGAAILALQQAGLLDPVIEPVQEFVEEEVVIPIQKSGKRTRTKFNRAVSAGMKAVRASPSYGKKGTINNAKKAFSAVTKVASKVNRGKKVAVKGVTGTIARAVRKIL